MVVLRSARASCFLARIRHVPYSGFAPDATRLQPHHRRDPWPQRALASFRTCPSSCSCRRSRSRPHSRPRTSPTAPSSWRRTWTGRRSRIRRSLPTGARSSSRAAGSTRRTTAAARRSTSWTPTATARACWSRMARRRSGRPAGIAFSTPPRVIPKAARSTCAGWTTRARRLRSPASKTPRATWSGLPTGRRSHSPCRSIRTTPGPSVCRDGPRAPLGPTRPRSSRGSCTGATVVDTSTRATRTSSWCRPTGARRVSSPTATGTTTGSPGRPTVPRSSSRRYGSRTPNTNGASRTSTRSRSPAGPSPA